jgi:hypothetical protein
MSMDLTVCAPLMAGSTLSGSCPQPMVMFCPEDPGDDPDADPDDDPPQAAAASAVAAASAASVTRREAGILTVKGPLSGGFGQAVLVLGRA